ncbi:hypothetical protein QBC38DRAFT_457760 [Podospora fimiseda]|uniref:Ankyrin n=1 Tax=Podospora fimiseda TaxID=252190 RepID=A0AAN7BKH5_9PEZI|nr:hypothetical protein QBC38DRAFT_457760 [Podospora fimiseda]
MLLDRGADVVVQGGFFGNALQAAVWVAAEKEEGTDDEFVLEILQKGADINAVGGFYGTALQATLATGKQRMARMLMQRGAHINVVEAGIFGTTLHAAYHGGGQELASSLITMGADVNAYGREGLREKLTRDEEMERWDAKMERWDLDGVAPRQRLTNPPGNCPMLGGLPELSKLTRGRVDLALAPPLQWAAKIGDDRW